MNRCKTCKFWDRAELDNEFYHDNMGLCSSNKLNDNDYYDREFRIANKEDMLIYQWHEGGNFYTGSEFGCVHHKEEAKNEQAN